MPKASLGKHWFNNGVVETYAFEQPDGFVRGRLSFSKETREKMSRNNIWKRATQEQKERRKENFSKTISSRTKEEREAYSLKLSAIQKSINRKPYVVWNKGKKGCQVAWNKGLKCPLSKESVESMLRKQHETKKANNSFNISRKEDSLYKDLCAKYGEKNIVRQYRDLRYPFSCDFYVISLDLFIEYNGCWTHGGKPFDENDKECLEKLAIWKEKAKTSKYYENAIYTWTDLDVRKRALAKENKLNYVVMY